MTMNQPTDSAASGLASKRGGRVPAASVVIPPSYPGDASVIAEPWRSQNGTMTAVQPDAAQPAAAQLARLAALLADRTRAQFCLVLLDGRAWTAGELAGRAGVAASTASEHLDRLIAAGLLRQRRQGRHRSVETRRAGRRATTGGPHRAPRPGAVTLA